jgi:hypothetical protein
MSVMTSVIPRGRPFTVDDLEGMPDDGNRYELIDGTLLVTRHPGGRTRRWAVRCTCCSGSTARRSCGC